MVIGRLLSPVHSLGPGERVCLWTQGCKKGCKGCIAPELQGPCGSEIGAEKLARLLLGLAKKGGCDGLTLSGGDPFEQPKELLALLRGVRSGFSDILVYTGYTLGELLGGIAGEEGRLCLEYIDVLIDGRYEQALNRPDCVLRGSANQIIHFLNEDLKARYLTYMKKGRILESFAHDRTAIITGILNKEDKP